MPRSRAERELEAMVDALRHEPGYVTGTWIDEAAGIYVGWVARPGGLDAAMPLRMPGKDLVLVFSGEEYPDPVTRSRWTPPGCAEPRDGLSYLVGMAEGAANFPTDLNGRFHGVLVRGGEVTLFNDRFGIHRLYYHQSADAFYFAAEAKAILRVQPALRHLDVRALGEFVSCGCVLENRSLFRGIQVVPPASAWLFRHGTLEQQRKYFEAAEWENQPAVDPETFYQSVRDVFSRNLSRYFTGPQRIGMSLTGGLDTRMIMAWEKRGPGTLPCYSFGSASRDTHDVQVARAVASACGQPYQVIKVGDDFLARFPTHAERTVYMTDGCVEVSHAPDLFANARAATVAPVRMTGNYGGEVLRRVRAFKPVQPPAGLFQQELLGWLKTAETTYAGLLNMSPLSFSLFRQTPWHHFGLLALEQTQLSIRSPYLDNDFVRTLFRAPGVAVTDDRLSLRLIADGDPALRRIRTDRGAAADQGRLSAALSRRLREFSFKAEYAYDYGMPQWLARVDRVLSPVRPERLFLGRHKFYHFRLWYRRELAGYVREVLLDRRTLARPYLNRASVEHLVASHLSGRGNYTAAIHKLLTLELLQRQLLD